jgi:hypothetical protein
MNENELFCFFGLCICGNKGMFKVNGEVISGLKQHFIMPSTPFFYHSSTPVSTYLTLHNLAKCTCSRHTQNLSNTVCFYPKCSVMGQRVFMTFLGVWFLFKNIYYPFLYFYPLLMASFICCYQKHVISALSMHCRHMLLVEPVRNCPVGIRSRNVVSLHTS